MDGPIPRLAGRTILQMVPALDAGGTEQATVDVSAALARAGARSLVLSRGGRMAERIGRDGGEFQAFPAHVKNPARMLAAAISLARLVRAEKVDLVHARSRAPAWVGLAATRLARVSFVTTWHGTYSARSAPKRLYNSVMARGDRVIANSRFTADRIAAFHPFARDRLVVIHSGTDLARFDPVAVPPGRAAALRAAWGIAPGRRIVLLAARLTGWKGHEVLLEAAARLRAGGGFDDLAIVFAGDPQGRDDYVRRLDARTGELGLAAHVFRVGHVADVPAAMAAADAVAVPSTEPEAFGRVAVEAQAMGVPVVVSDHGAVPETVRGPPDAPEEERTGWRVPPADAPALAGALAEALGLTPEGRAALAVRGRAQAARFSADAMTEATLDVYAGQLAAAGPDG